MSKLTNISTKGGDSGKTSLYSGERLHKSHEVFQTMADLDTFDAGIGVLRSRLNMGCQLDLYLRIIQTKLILVKGEIATNPAKWFDLTMNKTISEHDVKELESWGENFKERLEDRGYEISGWVIYGDDGRTSADLDFIRALCRKSEISIYVLKDMYEKNLDTCKYKMNPNLLKFINRLSDLFYWMSRIESR